VRAIVYRGEGRAVDLDVVDGRTTGTWFPLGARGVKPRRKPLRLGVIHHQGGEGGALQLFRVLSTKGYGIHFQVAQDGTITQMADLDHAVAHAGKWNPDSWGVECASNGVAPAAKRWPREVYLDRLHGRKVRFLRLYPVQIDALAQLAAEVHRILGLPLDLPMDGDRVARSVMLDTALATHRGLVCHWHLTDRKCDCDPATADALAQRACR
jgi:hypothetical protein